ncbi:MAG: 1-deoxy-D-xylulose-5-phosphate reductoisomerase [Rhizobiaceae bacterium]|jgi:1-deoxy-D-xylulose-5-phosphate reductoisomerase|nr:1-deoxy-D-xylulose-5-phosphate reductoisomerase [Rhizobiaceae bacterium]
MLNTLHSDVTLPRRISVLGATGSIGVSTLDVLQQAGGRERFDVVALTGMGNAALLAEQAKAIGARIAVTADEANLGELTERLAGSGIQAAAGRQALIDAASEPADWVMAGIVGLAGLAPTMAAARAGATVALANKECMVSAGDLFLRETAKAGVTVVPVDSEHSAIHQCLSAEPDHTVERVIITASGGPFRTFTRDAMEGVTPDQAAGHPKWSMGRKISIDSASMFNKGLEMIEARHLFHLAPAQIEVVVHPQSIVHSAVSFTDGSMIAQLGMPDMRTPIAYALAHPSRIAVNVERLDLIKAGRLEFEAPDEARFPALRLAREAMAHGRAAGAVLNGAKEVALEAFMARRIGFLAMADIVERVMAQLAHLPAPQTLDDVHAADAEARARASAIIA